jgi:hypothetical protein
MCLLLLRCEDDSRSESAYISLCPIRATKKEQRVMATSTLTQVTGSVKQQNGVPTRKVIAGGLAGALVTIIVIVANTYWLPSEKPLPSELAAALTTVLSFIISYVVPPAASDQVTAA